MKRSDMLNKLIMEPIEVLSEIDIHLFRAEAEAILKRLEELGMKPPENMKSPECSHCSRSDYSWEPEDETK